MGFNLDYTLSLISLLCLLCLIYSNLVMGYFSYCIYFGVFNTLHKIIFYNYV